QLHEGRKFIKTKLLSAFTARRERTTRRQPREIRWLTRNLIEAVVIRCWIGNRLEQSTRVRIARSRKQFRRRRLLKDFAGVHDNQVVSHAGDNSKVVRD